MNLYGIPITESVYAVSRFPARKHNARKGSPAYHQRIQKKWNKRFGFVEEPCIFSLNNNSLLMVHPTIMAQLKAARGLLQSNTQQMI